MKSIVVDISRDESVSKWNLYECVLAESIRCVASELRMHDAVDLIDMVRSRNYRNLEDLVNSSTELYFKPGVLIFGWGGNASITWYGGGTVSLDLEFRDQNVHVFFSLTLAPASATIVIHDMAHGIRQCAPSIDEFRAALDNARIHSAIASSTKGTDDNI